MLWEPIADALRGEFTVYLWDMLGCGLSTKSSRQDVSLPTQAQVFTELLRHWELTEAPRVVAHDFGGTVALRAHLLHGAAYRSLSLVDVVAVAPWGSDFFRLVGEHAEVFARLPGHLHKALVEAYISDAAYLPLVPTVLDRLVRPWLGSVGQAAFYRQIEQADQSDTDAVEPLYPRIALPTLIVWGKNDSWIPVDRAYRLAELIPGAELRVLPEAGHLIQQDATDDLTDTLRTFLRN